MGISPVDEPDISKEVLRMKDGYYLNTVYRQGDIIHKDAGPWSVAVHSLLRHLEIVGFNTAPKVVGNGFDTEGKETLTYINGQIMDSEPLTEGGAFEVGVLLRRLHEATASYKAPEHSVWYPWFGRKLGNPVMISHSGCRFSIVAIWAARASQSNRRSDRIALNNGAGGEHAILQGAYSKAIVASDPSEPG